MNFSSKYNLLLILYKYYINKPIKIFMNEIKFKYFNAACILCYIDFKNDNL